MNRVLLLVGILVFFGCQHDEQLHQAQQIAENIRAEFAPDKRVALFRIDTMISKSGLEIHGETTLPAAKTKFFEQLTAAKIEFTDSLTLLPAKDLGGKHFGMVNVSVCNIRSEPRHSAELATQALMGFQLRVWKKEGDFYLVQTPDDYFGWLDDGGFQLMTETELENWSKSPLGIIKSDFIFAYEKPSTESPKITDLVAGNIVQVVENQAVFTKIKLPDGRNAYVQNIAISSLGNWLESRQPTAENILATANEMMGRPYLWGGTSGKGMDCSGFTKMAYFLNGVELPRDASQQVHVGEQVETDTASLQNLQPGDLLFFGRKASADKKEKITHVAMYLGGGKIIHASDRVKVESLVRGDTAFVEDRLKTFVRSKRVIGNVGKNGVRLVADSPYFQSSGQLKD